MAVSNIMDKNARLKDLPCSLARSLAYLLATFCHNHNHIHIHLLDPFFSFFLSFFARFTGPSGEGPQIAGMKGVGWGGVCEKRHAFAFAFALPPSLLFPSPPPSLKKSKEKEFSRRVQVFEKFMTHWLEGKGGGVRFFFLLLLFTENTARQGPRKKE